MYNTSLHRILLPQQLELILAAEFQALAPSTVRSLFGALDVRGFACDTARPFAGAVLFPGTAVLAHETG